MYDVLVVPNFVAKTQDSSVFGQKLETLTVPSLRDSTDGDQDESCYTLSAGLVNT